MTHAPGPYKLDGYNALHDCDGRLLASLTDWRGGGEKVATARLLASSPELLKALIEIYRSMPKTHPNEPEDLIFKWVRQTAGAAIAAAEQVPT